MIQTSQQNQLKTKLADFLRPYQYARPTRLKTLTNVPKTRLPPPIGFLFGFSFFSVTVKFYITRQTLLTHHIKENGPTRIQNQSTKPCPPLCYDIHLSEYIEEVVSIAGASNPLWWSLSNPQSIRGLYSSSSSWSYTNSGISISPLLICSHRNSVRLIYLSFPYNLQ